ncbi:hypothetical protein, partial [Mesorhizobium sp. M8A.F.Ca.ET.021.01.1.1]|uniref:hypothetical protein n=1 Tax=Mesorhizobium sp. M8A.F.Ca.ET.021.01.1.1 TaxID=2496757 RepID=UPI001AECE464
PRYLPSRRSAAEVSHVQPKCGRRLVTVIAVLRESQKRQEGRNVAEGRGLHPAECRLRASNDARLGSIKKREQTFASACKHFGKAPLRARARPGNGLAELDV